MTDPRTPDDPGLPEEPRLPEQPPAAAPPEQPAAPEPAEPEQVASFATEPPVESPAEPAESPTEPAESPAEPAEDATPPGDAAVSAPEPVEPEQTATLADEEPVDPPVDAGPGADDDAAPPVRTRRAWLPVAALGTAVALLTAGAGYLTWELRQESRAEQAREEATSAARDAARLLFSYDHTTLEQDFEKGLSVTTGEFREQYRRTTQEVVTPVAEQYDAVVVAEVIEAAVVQASADEVTALVFLNQGTTSTRVRGQQVDQSRVRMQLVREDGRWLVQGVSAL